MERKQFSGAYAAIAVYIRNRYEWEFRENRCL